MTVCEQCRKAEATITLSYRAGCKSLDLMVCAGCARAPSLPHPFTLKPLAATAPRTTPRPR